MFECFQVNKITVVEIESRSQVKSSQISKGVKINVVTLYYLAVFEYNLSKKPQVTV